MGRGHPRRSVLSDPGSDLAALKRENAKLLAKSAEFLARKDKLLERNKQLRADLADAQAAGAYAAERAARAGLGPTAARAATAESHPVLDKYQAILASLRDRQSQGGALTCEEHALIELSGALADAAGNLERFVAQWQADEVYMNEVVARYFRLAAEIEPLYLDVTLTQMREQDQEKREREQADAERVATDQARRLRGAEESAKIRSAKADERQKQLLARGRALAAGVPARLLNATRVAEAMAKDPKCRELAPSRGLKAKEAWKSWMPTARLVLEGS